MSAFGQERTLPNVYSSQCKHDFPLGHHKSGVHFSWEEAKNQTIPTSDSVIHWQNGNLAWIFFIKTGGRQMEVGFTGEN